MKWDFIDIVKIVGGGGAFTVVMGIIANFMGWLRFKKTDDARVNKVQAETAIDLATVTEKRISDEVKISDAALQWTVNLATRLEQANMIIDKKQEENDRLHNIIDVMKQDFERDFGKLKEDFNVRIIELEKEFKASRQDLMDEREINRQEIETLKKQIDGFK